MLIKEARKLLDDFYYKKEHLPEEEKLFVEAVKFLIDRENKPLDMMNLGSFYYDKKEYGSALKYYEMAAAMEYVPAYEMLAAIWYYGKTGTTDYIKAKEYFTWLKDRGNKAAAEMLDEIDKKELA